LAPQAVGAAGPAAELVAAAHALEARLAATGAPALAPAVDDMRAQLRRLLAPGFVTRGGLGRLGDLRRYMEAVRLRLDKLGQRPERDRDLMLRVQRLESDYDERQDDPAGVDVRWMLEELRVSFFAQVLGTARPVSEQRIRRALAER
jgi:ATP-dependent helicase HrpA